MRFGCPNSPGPLRSSGIARTPARSSTADRPICRRSPALPALHTRIASSSRSASDRYRPESGFADRLNIAGGMPPAFRTICSDSLRHNTGRNRRRPHLPCPAAMAAQPSPLIASCTAVDLVTTMAAAQIVPNAVFDWPSHLLPQGVATTN